MANKPHEHKLIHNGPEHATATIVLAHGAGAGMDTEFIQGERDALGTKDEVGGYELSKKVKIHWLPDGDHSFKPRKASGTTVEENWQDGIKAVADFSRLLADR